MYRHKFFTPHAGFVTLIPVLCVVTVYITQMAVAQNVPPGENDDSYGEVYVAPGQRLQSGYILVDDKHIDITNGSFHVCDVCGHCTGQAHVGPSVPFFREAAGPILVSVSSRGFSQVAPGTLPDMTQAFAYEDAISQILRKRSPDRERKPGWQILMESAGGAAAITVVFGGLIGGALTGAFQRKAKEREIELVQLDASTQRKLQKDQQFLEGQIKVITEILESVTSTSVAANNLFEITSERFQLGTNNSRDLRAYREEVRSRFNAADDEWKRRREVLGATLGTYHKQTSAIVVAWLRLRSATTDLVGTASDLYRRYYDQGGKVALADQIRQDLCEPKRRALDAALALFAEASFQFRTLVVPSDDVFHPTE